MGTLTANQRRLPEFCEHKLPTSCRLSSIPNCCACADERSHSSAYRTYVDGRGFVLTGTRWQSYCWFCKEFWSNRVRASGMRQAQTRIPQVPDQTEFLKRWYEFHQGYRLVKAEDGTEVRVAILGEDFGNVNPGCLPRTLEQLRAGRAGNDDLRLLPRQIEAEETPQPAQPTLDETLDELMREAETSDDIQTPPVLVTEQNIIVSNRPLRQLEPHQHRRAAALRRELQRMRNGIERVIRGLRDLGQEAPGHDETTERLSVLDAAITSNSVSLSPRDAEQSLSSINALASATESLQENEMLRYLQQRATDARNELDEARRVRNRMMNELTEAQTEFDAAQQRLDQAHRDQRSAENYTRVFGTREEIVRQGEEYVSPLTNMFTRAYERFQTAEEIRREQRTLMQVLEDEERTGIGYQHEHPPGSAPTPVDVWSVPTAIQPAPNALYMPAGSVDTALGFSLIRTWSYPSYPGERPMPLEVQELLAKIHTPVVLPEYFVNRMSFHTEDEYSAGRRYMITALKRDESFRQGILDSNPALREALDGNLDFSLVNAERDVVITAMMHDPLYLWLCGIPQYYARSSRMNIFELGIDLLPTRPWCFIVGSMATAYCLNSDVYDFCQRSEEDRHRMKMRLLDDQGSPDDLVAILELVTRGEARSLASKALTELTPQEWTWEDARWISATLGSNQDIIARYNLNDIVTEFETLLITQEILQRPRLPADLIRLYRVLLKSDGFLQETDLAGQWLLRRMHYLERGGESLSLPETCSDSDSIVCDIQDNVVNPSLKLGAVDLISTHLTGTVLETLDLNDYDITPSIIARLYADTADDVEKHFFDDFWQAKHALIRTALLQDGIEHMSMVRPLKISVRFGIAENLWLAGYNDFMADHPTHLTSTWEFIEDSSNGSEDNASNLGLDDPSTGRPEAKQDDEMRVLMDCKVCYSQVADVACLPCGHLVMCTWCSDQHSPTLPHDRTRPLGDANCPLCRKRVRNKVRVFR